MAELVKDLTELMKKETEGDDGKGKDGLDPAVRGDGPDGPDVPDGGREDGGGYGFPEREPPLPPPALLPEQMAVVELWPAELIVSASALKLVCPPGTRRDLGQETLSLLETVRRDAHDDSSIINKVLYVI